MTIDDIIARRKATGKRKREVDDVDGSEEEEEDDVSEEEEEDELDESEEEDGEGKSILVSDGIIKHLLTKRSVLQGSERTHLSTWAKMRTMTGKMSWRMRTPRILNKKMNSMTTKDGSHPTKATKKPPKTKPKRTPISHQTSPSTATTSPNPKRRLPS